MLQRLNKNIQTGAYLVSHPIYLSSIPVLYFLQESCGPMILVESNGE